SKVGELTLAVLVSVLPSGVLVLTRTTMVKVAVAPLASDAVVQVTVPVVPTAGVVQVQPAGLVIDWKVVCDGSRSVTVTFAAVEGPLLVSARVEVRLAPGGTGPGGSGLVIDRSGEAMTADDEE